MPCSTAQDGHVPPCPTLKTSNLHRNLPNPTQRSASLYNTFPHGPVVQPRAFNTSPARLESDASSGGALREVDFIVIRNADTTNLIFPPQPFGISLSLPASHTHTPHTLPCLRCNHDQPRLAAEAQLAAAEEVFLPEEDAAAEVMQPTATRQTQRQQHQLKMRAK